MCNPMAFAIGATALAAVGTAVATVSAARQASFDGKIANNNAKIASEQAADAIERGKLDQQQQMRRNAQLAGAQRLALSANGIETDFGSAADIQRDTSMLAGEEYATIAKNTEREAQGYDISASNFGSAASSAKSRKSAAIIGGIANFGGTILSGAKQVGKIKADRAAGGSGF